MAIEVRSYTDADAGALADLLNRNAYGPAEFGVELTADQVRQVLTERGIVECIVGDDGEALRGCIALAIGSGRRAAAAHERFAGLFVIDDRYRNSMLAGKLFREVFADRVRSGGIRTLRIEANPANARAFPLYLRVGFRALPGARPDEDGYVELVSHLPGVIEDLIRANPGADVDEIAVKLNWRMMRAGRDADPAAGVVERNGRLVVDYPIDTGDLELVAVVDHALGTVVEIEQASGAAIATPEPAAVTAQAALAEILRVPLDGDHAIVVFDDGTIELQREEELREAVLLRERWPVVLGVDAPAVRRQGERRKVRALGEGLVWQLLAEGDAISRELRIDASGRIFDLTTRPPVGARVLTVPWVTMRVAEHALRAEDDRWTGGPVLPGRWPSDWGDFEAARDDLAATAAWWSDGRTGMRLSWVGAARADSRSAPALRSAHPGDEVCLRVELSGETPVVTSGPDGVHRVAAPPRRRRAGIVTHASLETTATREASGALLTLEIAAERGAVRELRAGDQLVRLASEAGIVEWRVGDAPILRGPYPASRPFGSLVQRRTGLWCTAISARDDADQGVEWVDDRAALAYADAGEDLIVPGHWNVEALGAAGLRVRAEAVGGETSIHLTPDTGGAAEFVVSVLGRRWRVDAGHPWRGSVDAAAVVLRDGRALVLVTEGRGTELFLRSMGTGTLVTALSEGPLELRMHVVGSRALAERLLAAEARAGGA